MATENILGGAFILLVLFWMLRGWIRAPSRGSIIAALIMGGLVTLLTVALILSGIAGAFVVTVIVTAGALFLRMVKQPERTDTEEALHTMTTHDTTEIAKEIERRNED